MANVFANLPLPALNGPGAAVNTSTMGEGKTIVVNGEFPGAAITIEASVDGGVEFAPVTTFQSGDNQRAVAVVAQFMRINVSGRKAGMLFTANIDVGANDIGALFIALAMPAGNGTGVPTNASAMGSFTTFIIGGDFPGARVLIEASEDGVDFAPVVQFTGQGGLASKSIIAEEYRVSVSGRKDSVPFTATAAAGSSNDAGTGDDCDCPGDGVDSVRVGTGAGASGGGGQTAVGFGASATTLSGGGTAIGRSAVAGSDSVSIGVLATTAVADGSVAVGNFATVTDNNGTVVGAGATAAQDSAALGNSSNAGDMSVAVGYNAQAFSPFSTAVGHAASASGTDGSVAIGPANATDAGVAIGYGAAVEAAGVGIGRLATVHDTNGIAIGLSAITAVGATGAIAIGANSNAGGIDGVALGRAANSTAGNGIAIGAEAVALAAEAIIGDPVGSPIADFIVKATAANGTDLLRAIPGPADITVSGQVGLFISVDRAGTITSDPVFAGIADSGGLGFRLLTIAN